MRPLCGASAAGQLAPNKVKEPGSARAVQTSAERLARPIDPTQRLSLRTKRESRSLPSGKSSRRIDYAPHTASVSTTSLKARSYTKNGIQQISNRSSRSCRRPQLLGAPLLNEVRTNDEVRSLAPHRRLVRRVDAVRLHRRPPAMHSPVVTEARETRRVAGSERLGQDESGHVESVRGLCKAPQTGTLAFGSSCK